MKQAVYLSLLLLPLWAMPAWSAQDGHKLYQSCQLAQVPQDGIANKDFDFDDYYGVGYCDGLIQGVSEALANQKRFCLLKGVRFSQIKRQVLAYLEARPAERNLKATQAAYNALLFHYPCQHNPGLN